MCPGRARRPPPPSPTPTSRRGAFVGARPAVLRRPPPVVPRLPASQGRPVEGIRRDRRSHLCLGSLGGRSRGRRPRPAGRPPRPAGRRPGRAGRRTDHGGHRRGPAAGLTGPAGYRPRPARHRPGPARAPSKPCPCGRSPCIGRRALRRSYHRPAGGPTLRRVEGPVPGQTPTKCLSSSLPGAGSGAAKASSFGVLNAWAKPAMDSSASRAAAT